MYISIEKRFVYVRVRHDIVRVFYISLVKGNASVYLLSRLVRVLCQRVGVMVMGKVVVG
jgi:hypothetical protein